MRTRSEGQGAGAAVDAALARGTLYTALALGFRAPTRETLERLASAGGAAALGDAAAVIDAGLRARANALAHPEVDVDRLAATHRRLFGHTARGEVPAYETEYGNEALFQQPQELADLAGFLAAFGLAQRSDVRERLDHVSCECELLAFLAYKEAFAGDTGDAAMYAATVQASTLFLRDHLGRLVPTFARRVARADPNGFYQALAALLHGLVAHDCRRLGVALGAESLGLRPDPNTVAAPMGCEQCEVGGPTA
jgi:TorA maturation chaperone TorD